MKVRVKWFTTSPVFDPSVGFWMVTGGYRVSGYCPHCKWADAIRCALDLPPWSYDEDRNAAARSEQR